MRIHPDPTVGSAGPGTEARLLVLHVLRLGGFVSAEAIAARTDLAPDTVATALAVDSAAGLVVHRSGRISGWSLTKDGKAEHARVLADELLVRGARPAAAAASSTFLELNEPFKELCSRWQLQPDGRPNDHTDAGYDQAVIADLQPVHERVVALTTGVAAALPRFARYPRAFRAALARLHDGDRRAFAAPLSDSYHDVWMELHQDLLSTLGRERSAGDGH